MAPPFARRFSFSLRVLSIAVCGDQRLARLLSLTVTVAVLVAHGCAPATPAATTLHELAEQYVRVTLQIAQHRPAVVDSFTGPAEWQPGPRVPVAELRSTVDALLARANGVQPSSLDPTERPRLAYLHGQLRSLALIVDRLLGERTTFLSEIAAMFGTTPPRVDDTAITATRDALERELPGSGDLADRYVAFRRQFVVDAKQSEPVIRAAIEECRAAAAPHLALPADERLSLAFDEAIEWDAYARYRGRHETHVQIASVAGQDVATVLRMACHETYAGHHAQHILIDDALVRGRRWLEFHLGPAFGPHKLISEGAAEVGVDLALPEEVRAKIYRDRLLPLARLPVTNATRLARVETLAAALDVTVPRTIAAYLDNEATAAETATRLAREALIPSAAQFVSFAERHRTNAVVYPVGKAVVSQSVVRGTTIDERWRKLQDLFTRTPFAPN